MQLWGMSHTSLLLPIEQLKLNPENPRLIKDHRFEALKKSIQDFPEMLHIRPLVVDENYVVLGGNMRLQALLQLQYVEVPVLVITGLTEQQKREFIIKDNASFGEWNWDELANNWSDLDLPSWIDVPSSWTEEEPSGEDLLGEGAGKPPVMKITFTTPEQLQKAENKIQELLDREYPGAFLSVSAGGI